MTTKRSPLSRALRVRITPAAVAAYRRLCGWAGKCTCPATAPYPGQIYDSSDPICLERERRYRKEREAYEAARAACPACPAIAREHEALLAELRLVLKPWQRGIADFPALEAALAQAARQPVKKRASGRPKAPPPPAGS